MDLPTSQQPEDIEMANMSPAADNSKSLTGIVSDGKIDYERVVDIVVKKLQEAGLPITSSPHVGKLGKLIIGAIAGDFTTLGIMFCVRESTSRNRVHLTGILKGSTKPPVAKTPTDILMNKLTRRVIRNIRRKDEFYASKGEDFDKALGNKVWKIIAHYVYAEAFTPMYDELYEFHNKFHIVQ